MICDSCIVQLNVAYNFKMKSIESDTKLHQYVIEKGFDYGGLPAITDGNSHRGGGNSISNFITTANTHTICDFVQPSEPSRMVNELPDNVTIANEYLRHFETPQSMVSSGGNGGAKPQPAVPQPVFRCMPIQIKVEYIDEGDQQSPTSSESHMQTISDTSSVRSNEHLNGGMVRVDDGIGGGKGSDEDFVSNYLVQQPEKAVDTSFESKSSSTKSSTRRPGPKSKTQVESPKEKVTKKPEKKAEKVEPKDKVKRKRKASEVEKLEKLVGPGKRKKRTDTPEEKTKSKKEEKNKSKVDEKSSEKKLKTPDETKKQQKPRDWRSLRQPDIPTRTNPTRSMVKLSAPKPDTKRTPRSWKDKKIYFCMCCLDLL